MRPRARCPARRKRDRRAPCRGDEALLRRYWEIVWTTLLLALLAAGAICALVGRVREAADQRGLPRPPGLARAALLQGLLPLIALLGLIFF